MNWGKFLFSFQGRISRKAFWLFLLAMIVINVVIGLLQPQPQIDPSMDPSAAMSAAFGATPWWSWLLSLVFLVVSIMVYAKRWHDQDRSGWWSLLLLVPFIGWLAVLIMLGFIPGTPGPNRFGEGPMA